MALTKIDQIDAFFGCHGFETTSWGCHEGEILMKCPQGHVAPPPFDGRRQDFLLPQISFPGRVNLADSRNPKKPLLRFSTCTESATLVVPASCLRFSACARACTYPLVPARLFALLAIHMHMRHALGTKLYGGRACAHPLCARHACWHSLPRTCLCGRRF